MLLSEMLLKLHRDRSLVENELFCELVQLAWNDFQDRFYCYYGGNDRENYLYGYKVEVEGQLGSTIRLLTVDGKRVYGIDYIKNRIGWIDDACTVDNIERGIAIQAGIEKYILTLYKDRKVIHDNRKNIIELQGALETVYLSKVDWDAERLKESSD